MDTTLTIKLPKELSATAKATAQSMGLTLTTVMHHQLRNFIESGEITFSTPIEMRRVSSKDLPREAKAKLHIARNLDTCEWKNI